MVFYEASPSGRLGGKEPLLGLLEVDDVPNGIEVLSDAGLSAGDLIG